MCHTTQLNYTISLYFHTGCKHILLPDVWGSSRSRKHGWLATEISNWGPNCELWSDADSDLQKEASKAGPTNSYCASPIFCTSLYHTYIVCQQCSQCYLRIVVCWFGRFRYNSGQPGPHIVGQDLAIILSAVQWKPHIFWETGNILKEILQPSNRQSQLSVIFWQVLSLIIFKLWKLPISTHVNEGKIRT